MLNDAQIVVITHANSRILAIEGHSNDNVCLISLFLCGTSINISCFRSMDQLISVAKYVNH